MNDPHEDRTPEDRETGTRQPKQRRTRERADAEAESIPKRKNVTAADWRDAV